MEAADLVFMGSAWMKLASYAYRIRSCVLPWLDGKMKRPVWSVKICPMESITAAKQWWDSRPGGAEAGKRSVSVSGGKGCKGSCSWSSWLVCWACAASSDLSAIGCGLVDRRFFLTWSRGAVATELGGYLANGVVERPGKLEM